MKASTSRSELGDLGAAAWLAAVLGVAFSAAAVAPDGWRRPASAASILLAGVLVPFAQRSPAPLRGFLRWSAVFAVAVAVATALLPTSRPSGDPPAAGLPNAEASTASPQQEDPYADAPVPGEPCKVKRTATAPTEALERTLLALEGRELTVALHGTRVVENVELLAHLDGPLRPSDQVWLDLTTSTYGGLPHFDYAHQQCGYTAVGTDVSPAVTQGYVLKALPQAAARACAAAVDRDGVNQYVCTRWHQLST